MRFRCPPDRGHQRLLPHGCHGGFGRGFVEFQIDTDRGGGYQNRREHREYATQNRESQHGRTPATNQILSRWGLVNQFYGVSPNTSGLMWGGQSWPQPPFRRPSLLKSRPQRKPGQNCPHKVQVSCHCTMRAPIAGAGQNRRPFAVVTPAAEPEFPVSSISQPEPSEKSHI